MSTEPRIIPQILKENDNSTLFYFPFDNDKKPKTIAFQEIKKTLHSLPDNTVLFLQNIEEINWEIIENTKEVGFLRRSEIKENHFQIEKKTDKLQKTYWLRFTKEFLVENNKNSYVSIAFRLTKLHESVEFNIDGKENKGDVSIFFPAEKENSGLNFFIHAPFASTVARDSIQNRPENEKLRDLLVELLIELLPKIKEYGMLDKNFLFILPNNDDDLSDFYEPFRDNLINIFQTQNFTPTLNGNFAPAFNLLQANNDIKKIINKETILSYVANDKSGNKTLDWSINALKNSRTHKFLESLEIEEWSWEILLKKIGSTFANKGNADAFFKNLTDEWFQSFYILLAKAKQETTYRYFSSQEKIDNAYIVRCENNSFAVARQCFFQTKFIKRADNLQIVKDKIYTSNKDKTLNDKAKEFLKSIGVREFEEKDEILAILDENYLADNLKYTKERNITHIEKFVSFWKSNQDEADIFSEYKFLRCENEDENKYLCEPTEIYLDAPFEITELSIIDKFLGESKLWKGYNDELKNKSDFISFLKAVGVIFRLKIKETSVWNNPVWQGQRTSDGSDYTISHLSEMLEISNRQISKLVWKTLINVDKKVFKSSCYGTEKHSQLILALRKIAWVPDNSGNFYRPQEMTREMLPNDFPFDNQNGWLDERVLGFGTETKKRIEEAQRDKNRKEILAREVGFKSVEQMEKAIELFMSPEKLARYEKFEQQEDLKERNSRNPHRKDSYLEDSEIYDNFSPRPRNIEIRERSVVEGYGNLKANEARPFLKQQYFEERELICQICQEEMPFKTLNNEYFFVAVKIIEKTIEDHIANYLCCCPNCAAMFQHANKHKENMAELILQGEEYTRGYFIPFELAEMSFDIHFTKKHFEQLLRFVGETDM
jgi:hypothetical protein